MPSTSIYLPKETLDAIDDLLDEDQSRSKWITQAIERQLDHEHDNIEELESRIADLENALINAAIYGGTPAEYLGEVTHNPGMGKDYITTTDQPHEEDLSQE